MKKARETFTLEDSNGPSSAAMRGYAHLHFLLARCFELPSDSAYGGTGAFSRYYEPLPPQIEHALRFFTFQEDFPSFSGFMSIERSPFLRISPLILPLPT